MNEVELREKIARRICTLNLKIDNYDELTKYQQDSWLSEANQILALIKQSQEKAPVSDDQQLCEEWQKWKESFISELRFYLSFPLR
jgi:hypothetical protein